MEALGKIAGTSNFGVFKEPRGFIKLIEWILSIFAFATTTSVNTELSFHVTKCPYGQSINEGIKVAYPFALGSEYYQVPLCNSTMENRKNGGTYVEDGTQSSAQFYVFVGVIVFLYCLAACIFYIFFDEQYRKNNVWSIADFVVSIVLTLFWLIGSAAWAQGLVNLKYYTDMSECGMFERIPDCKNYGCTQDIFPNFASLNVSIIFGFLNMVVWVGNLWFLYKETPWFKVVSKPPNTTGTPQETDPQRI